MKRLAIVMLLCVVLMMGVLSVTAMATHIVASGECGDNITWVLDGDGTLTISGEGEMHQYTNHYNIPWFDYNSQITDVVIENGVTSIGENAFYYCENLTNVRIPESVTFIGERAFSNCKSLTSVTIPDGVFFIDSYAFARCDDLQLVEISGSVIRIGAGAFYGCSELNEVRFKGDVPVFEQDGDPIFEINTTIYYPENNQSWLNLRKSGVLDVQWTVYVSDDYGTTLESGTCGEGILWIINGDGELRILGEGRMEDEVWSLPPWNDYDSIIESVVIEEGITSIRSKAFSGQGNMTSVTIPESVTEIGEYAFSSCRGLTSIVIPASVISIGDYAFYSCSNLTDVKVSEGVKIIENGAFSNCKSLRSIVIPRSVKKIGADAFSMNENLKQITFAGNAPDFENKYYTDDGVTINYPQDDTTWQIVIDRCKADIVWKTYFLGYDLYTFREENDNRGITNSALKEVVLSIFRGTAMGIGAVIVIAGITYGVYLMRNTVNKRKNTETDKQNKE